MMDGLSVNSTAAVHASAYEYPVALFNDPDGRVLLAHCPGNYCRLELEEAETGRGTASADRKPSDFPFAVGSEPSWKAAAQRRVDVASTKSRRVLDVAQALADPRHLDDRHICRHRSTRVWPRRVRPVGSTMTALQWLPRPSPNRIASSVTPGRVSVRMDWLSTT